jgi:hypothetical protein
MFSTVNLALADYTPSGELTTGKSGLAGRGRILILSFDPAGS